MGTIEYIVTIPASAQEFRSRAFAAANSHEVMPVTAERRLDELSMRRQGLPASIASTREFKFRIVQIDTPNRNHFSIIAHEVEENGGALLYIHHLENDDNKVIIKTAAGELHA